MSLLFISHSSKDNAQTIALKNWLAKNGWEDLFLDFDPNHGISSGEKWKEVLIQASDYCDAVILLISDNWLKSEYCIEEYRTAKILKKQIFPLIIDTNCKDSIPKEIRDWHCINLNSGYDFLTQTVDLPDGTQADVSFSDDGLTALKKGLTKADLHPSSFTWPPQNEYANPPSPYKGLRPLEAKDAGIFFGRDGTILEFIKQLRGSHDTPPTPPPRFMVVLGASGAGKSSFVRAGVLPRLVRDKLHFLVMPTIRPESAVITGTNGLLNALAKMAEDKKPELTRKHLSLAIEEGKDTLLPILKSIIDANTLTIEGTLKTTPKLVITLDQAEELFQPEGKVEAQQFLPLLAELVNDSDINLLIISTIRSDTYKPLQDAETLSGINQHLFSLPSIVKGAYNQIIEGPAKLLEKTKKPLVIDPQLTQRLLEDLEDGGSGDALPLLAFTLERLYRDYSSDGKLQLKEYLTFEEELGDKTVHLGLNGLKGAVSAAVDEALQQAQKDPRIPSDRNACLKLLRRGFIPWLARIDPNTKQARSKIANYEKIPDDTKPIIDCLIERRLLTKDVDNDKKNKTVEPAHESILRQWKQLKTWLKEDATDLSLLEILEVEARDWEKDKLNDEWLRIKGVRLQEAERLVSEGKFQDYITDSQKSYLQTCRAQENSEREDKLAQAEALAKKQNQVIVRTRLGLAVAVVLMLVSAGLAFLALKNQKEAEKQEVIAKQQEQISKENAQEAQKQKELAQDNSLRADLNAKNLELKNKQYKKILIESTEKNVQYLFTRGKLIDLSKTDLIGKTELKQVITQFDNIIRNEITPTYQIQNNGIHYLSKKFTLPKTLRITIEEKYPGLINLILATKSMDDSERQFWFDLFPYMTEERILNIYKIMAVEKVELIDLDERYKKEVFTLSEKILKTRIKIWDKKHNGKKIIPSVAKNYLKHYNMLLDYNFMEEADVLKKLVNIEQRYDLDEIINFQDFLTYRQLLEKIISLSKVKVNYQHKFWTFYQDAYYKGYISKHETTKKAVELSWALLNNKSFPKAVDVLKDGLQFNPNNILLEKNLGHAYFLQGDKKNAMEIYQKHSDKHVLIDKKTSLWQQLIFSELNILNATLNNSELTSDDLHQLNYSDIDKFVLGKNDYETIDKNINILMERKEHNTISSSEMVVALQTQQKMIRQSNSFYTRGMFELYKSVHYKINRLIDNRKKLLHAKHFLTISREMETKGIISQRELAEKMMNVTWHSLFSNNQTEYENSISLSEEGKGFSDFLLDPNYAHTLALLGKEKAALAIYKSHLGRMLYWSCGKEAGLWEDTILKDFKSLEEKGVNSPTFDKAKKLIGKYKKINLSKNHPDNDRKSKNDNSILEKSASDQKETSFEFEKLTDAYYQLIWIKNSPELYEFYQSFIVNCLSSENLPPKQSEKLAYLLVTNLSLNFNDKKWILEHFHELSKFKIDNLIQMFNEEKEKSIVLAKESPQSIKALILKSKDFFHRLHDMKKLIKGNIEKSRESILIKLKSAKTIINKGLKSSSIKELGNAYDQLAAYEVNHKDNISEAFSYQKEKIYFYKALFKKKQVSAHEYAQETYMLTWISLFTNNKSDLQFAVKVFRETKEIFPDHLNTSYPNALALLGLEDEALTFYQNNLGKMIKQANGDDIGLWENLLLDRFKALNENGINHPTFDKAKKLIEDYKAKQEVEKDKKS